MRTRRRIRPTPIPAISRSTNSRIKGLLVIAPTYAVIQVTAPFTMVVTSATRPPTVEAAGVVAIPSFQRFCKTAQRRRTRWPTRRPVQHRSAIAVNAEIGGVMRIVGKCSRNQRMNCSISCIPSPLPSARCNTAGWRRYQRTPTRHNQAGFPGYSRGWSRCYIDTGRQ